MSDLQSLLKRLSVSPVNTMSYVYYNKVTGKIHKISSKNIPEEGFEVFEVENEEVTPILTGEKRTEEFVIFYDVSLKQIRLKAVAYDDSYSTAATLCYQLPAIKYNSTDDVSLESDIVIRQDINNGEWNIRINPHTKKFLRMSGYNLKETLYFSVTSKYDPNILYRSLEFTIGNLISNNVSVIPFIYDTESNANGVSIYTAKYFDSYTHEVI
tara:strand:- start:1125 stop:1760 length:636 start_codon:yes stop_codon:yes gene_type:complete